MSKAANLIVRFHRLHLVIGTVLVAVGASALATDGEAVSSALILAGGAVLLYVADVASGFEVSAERLAEAANEDITSARSDLLTTRNAWGLAVAVALALAAIGSGLFVL